MDDEGRGGGGVPQHDTDIILAISLDDIGMSAAFQIPLLYCTCTCCCYGLQRARVGHSPLNRGVRSLPEPEPGGGVSKRLT